MSEVRKAQQESLVRAQFELTGAINSPGESLYRAHRAIVLDGLRHAVSLPDDLCATAVIMRAAEVYGYFAAVANGPEHSARLGPQALEEFLEFTKEIDTLCAYAQFVWDELPEPLRLRYPGFSEIVGAEHEWFGERIQELVAVWFGTDADPSEMPHVDGEKRTVEIPAEIFVRILRLMVTIMACWLDEADQSRFLEDLTRGAGIIGEWAPLLRLGSDGPKN